MQLPRGLTLSMMQTRWAVILNALLSNPSLDSLILQNQSLINGTTIINHGLGRKLQGWRIVRFHGSWAQIYDNQDSNTMPELTLSLTSNAVVTVDLEVF